MIPAAILNGVWKQQNTELEFSVLELGRDWFTFRTAKKYRQLMQNEGSSFCMRFYQYKSAEYRRVDIPVYETEAETESDFFITFRVTVENNQAFEEASSLLTKEYLGYIRGYLEEEPAVLSEILTGYPAEAEESFPPSYEAMKNALAEKSTKEEFAGKSFGLSLENSWQQEDFCRKSFPVFLQDYFQEAGFQSAPVKEEQIRWIYIGSQVCYFLLPKGDEVGSLLEKCYMLKKQAVLQLPPVKEHQMEEIQEFLKEWICRYQQLWKDKPEIVVNDWGMLHLLAEKKECAVTMGILLLKQKKDPRLCWKNGKEQISKDKKQSGWMSDIFLESMKERYHVTRYSAESNEMNEILPKEPVTLYAPWYQMNTATLCPLAAAIEEKDRGSQRERSICKKYCKAWNFLYPSHLSICGRYNTIWGYDKDWLTRRIGQGADRMVLNF